jgi:hypothetical protein
MLSQTRRRCQAKKAPRKPWISQAKNKTCVGNGFRVDCSLYGGRAGMVPKATR